MYFNTKKRVEKGIALLDKYVPDWHYRINIKQIEMEYSDYCILGQLYGDYNKGAAKLGLGEWEAYQCGFLPLVQVKWDLGFLFPWSLTRLAKIWKELITQKRKEDNSYFKFLKSIDAFGGEVRNMR
ncbi:MAG: hypothetical protein GTO02_15240 [Candidatus Dadabacteria bacterium]|nr:hypothetical protein [Candidatus Dadabacteria bacterium]